MDIEQNDVDLSQLFKWNRPVEIKNNRGKVVATVYMRVVGDADLNRARVFAIRESADLRVQLGEEGSIFNEAFLKDSQVLTVDEMIQALQMLRYPEYAIKARGDIGFKFPNSPGSDASLEEQEEYQKEIDEFPDRYDEKVTARVEEYMEKDEQTFREMEFDSLLSLYKRSLVNALCNQRMQERFTDMCVYLGTYKDKDMTSLAFESFEQYDNASSELKKQLSTAYKALELGIAEIKK